MRPISSSVVPLLLFAAAAGCASTRAGGTPAGGEPALRIGPGPAFRLAGLHVFDVGSGRSARWAAERVADGDSLSADALRRAPALSVVDSALGARATFALGAGDSTTTVYRIVARAGTVADTVLVRVFPAGVRTSFVHRGAGHPPVRVFLTVPPSLGAGTRLVMVMHGAGRNADGYADSWVRWAASNDYIAAAPEFTRADWGGASRYNLGNVLAGDEAQILAGGGTPVPAERWSYTVVDSLQVRLRRDFGLADPAFDIWGHSAGAQFVHRFLLFRPASPVRLAIAANAGWYTAPDPDVPFPFGTHHPAIGVGPAELARWTARPVVLMRGTADTLRDDDLRTGADADRQGRTRYARAAFMLARVKAANPATPWQLVEVPDAGHDQRRMTPAAQALLAERRRASR